ncbi:hypothetical protein D3C81_1986840 [compost metagenome]
MILLEYGQTFAGSNMHISDVGFNLAGQDFQEGRFARAVGSDKTVAVAGCEFYVYILE